MIVLLIKVAIVVRIVNKPLRVVLLLIKSQADIFCCFVLVMNLNFSFDIIVLDIPLYLQSLLCLCLAASKVDLLYLCPLDIPAHMH